MSLTISKITGYRIVELIIIRMITWRNAILRSN